jgi:hypothetical protein
MMRIKFTLAMLFAIRLNFFNSVNGADSSAGNFLIAAAYKFQLIPIR